jgi:hypothetical protein
MKRKIPKSKRIFNHLPLRILIHCDRLLQEIQIFCCRVLGSVIFILTSISMSLKVPCDVKSAQTTFTTGNIRAGSRSYADVFKLVFWVTIPTVTMLQSSIIYKG